LTLDDFDLRTQADADPESVVRRAPTLVLDEVQRSRDLLIAVKRVVDDDPARTPGRFVLTGSANLLMMERVSETLAGRAVYVTLWPFTRRERLGLGRAGAWSGLLSAPFGRWRDLLAADSGPEEDWRAATGIEVDFVIETPRRVLPIEVKAAARVGPSDAKGLEAFLDEYPDLADGALLLHGGAETFPLTRRVLAVPWWRVC